ncbi:MAG: carbohydrate ABC transporter permease [Pseudothermotoga sp.]|nr:carbohydrate ABC transporter permease [Pseudothermotoga sp.]
MKRILKWTLVAVVLAVWAVATVFPLYWMVQTSFTPETDIRQIPPRLFPSKPTLQNFRELFSYSRIWNWFLNSLIISSSITVGSIFICSAAAYALAKMEFRGRKLMFTAIVSTILVPPQVTLLPAFILINRFGLLDSLWAVVIPSLASPYTIFMMRQFMLSISQDYLDAARIDGAKEWMIYWRIILPMSKPVIAAASIFTFISSWNSFLWPLIVLNTPSKYPLTVGLATLQRLEMTQFGLQMAGSMFSALPMIIIFFAFQRYFVKGLMTGGTKG